MTKSKENIVRKNKLAILMSNEEAALLRLRAQMDGLSVSAWVRSIVLKELRKNNRGNNQMLSAG